MVATRSAWGASPTPCGRPCRRGRAVAVPALAASISAGLVDPASGLAEGWMEAMPGETSVAVVTLLRAMLDLRLHTTWRIDAYRAWAQRAEEVQAAIAAW